MDAVWAVDPRTPAWLAETFPRLVRASPASVWADPEVFYPGDEAERQADRAWLREEFDLAPTAEVCLFAGRLEAQKDVPTLIGAWAHVARRRPNAVLAIIGEGRSAPVARRLADRLGVAERIRWSGFRPWGELVRCYRAADCVACASAYEAGPRLVVEALACGTPSATFAVGEAPAMLEPLAELGLVVENRSERALGGAIARALELPGGPELAARCAAAAAPFTPARALAPVFERYREWFRQAEASP
jgi:glycosyltransferase involved in cell wall biosynthesis